MYLKDIILYIANIILKYYATYRSYTLNAYNEQQILSHIKKIVLYNMQHYFPSFDTVDNIEILEIPYNHVYLLDNDVCIFHDIEHELIQYVEKHHHIINNYDIIISINVLPLDGLDIRHGDILNMLDPLLL